MSELVPPHGNKNLKPLALEDDALTTELEKAKSLPKITCSSREFGDVIMLGIGGFTPLDGFKCMWQYDHFKRYFLANPDYFIY